MRFKNTTDGSLVPGVRGPKVSSAQGMPFSSHQALLTRHPQLPAAPAGPGPGSQASRLRF